MFRLRPALASVVVTAIAAAVAITVALLLPPTLREAPAIPTPPAPPGPLFIGDYSTGDFSQWPFMATRFYGSPSELLPGSGYIPAYPATIVDDPVKGKAARFEVRSGDLVGKTESSQVTGTAADTGGTEGEIRWYAFSTMFDPTFPMDHADLGWGLTNQWHEGSNQDGSPPFGFYLDQLDGYWSLVIQKQSRPTKFVSVFSIWDTPLDRGTWHDIKLQVKFSTSDTTGWIRLWHNGVRQTFLDGTDTFFVRTLIPGTTTVYYKEGYYRQPMDATGIVYQSGFRCADSEAALQV
jgi:Polysaccharide lyase